jgi:branched-chain amino acid aminotransferase
MITKVFNAIIDNNLVSQEELLRLKPLNSKVIYEVIRIINSVPIFIEDHLERFNNSIKSFLPHYKQNDPLILNRILKIIESNSLTIGNIKFELHIVPDTEPIFFAYIIPHYYPSEDQYKKGVTMEILYAERKNPLVKAEQKELRNLTNNILEKNQTFEILLLNNNQCITEGSKSNFFLIKDNTVYSAPLNTILHGITLKKVFQICSDLNIPIIETLTKEEELKNFDAAFISGTSPKILPVKSVDEFIFNPENSILRKIMNQYDTFIKNYIKNWNENFNNKNYKVF